MVNLNQIDLNLLLALDVLLKERHVSRAAEKLGLTQPAMSNALGRLRRLLEDPLFVRSGGVMLPTPRAQKLAVPLRQALDLLQSALETPFDFDPATAKQTFRIAMNDYCEMLILPGLIRWLEKSAPGLDVQMSQYPEGQLAGALAEGEVHLAVGLFPNIGEGLYQQKLFEDDFVCMVRGSHPQIKEALSLEQFLATPQVLVSTRTKSQGLVTRALAERGLERRVVLQVSHFLLLPLLIESTDLLVTLPERLAATFASRFDLKFFPPPLEVPGFSITQYWHERHHQNPAHRWLRSVLAQGPGR